MANIEFSELGRALVANRYIAEHIVTRLANLTPEEEASGIMQIHLTDGDESQTLDLRIGPGNKSVLDELQAAKKAKLTLAPS